LLLELLNGIGPLSILNERFMTVEKPVVPGGLHIRTCEPWITISNFSPIQRLTRILIRILRIFVLPLSRLLGKVFQILRQAQ
jgi:hypothetical protein